MAAKKAARMTERRLSLRKKYWPEVKEEELWVRQNTKGFTTIPRGLSILVRIMDSLSPGKPLSSTYLTLWCYAFDEMFITIQKPRQMALESGFGGQRAEYTWNSRMKKIEELGFIKSAAGVSGDFHYVLILNPYLVVRQLNEKHDVVPKELYNTLVERIEEIGEVAML